VHALASEVAALEAMLIDGEQALDGVLLVEDRGQDRQLALARVQAEHVDPVVDRLARLEQSLATEQHVDDDDRPHVAEVVATGVAQLHQRQQLLQHNVRRRLADLVIRGHLQEARDYVRRASELGESGNANDLRFALAVADEARTHLETARDAIAGLRADDLACGREAGDGDLTVWALEMEQGRIQNGLTSLAEQLRARLQALARFSEEAVGTEERLLALVYDVLHLPANDEGRAEATAAVRQKLEALEETLKDLEERSQDERRRQRVADLRKLADKVRFCDEFF
jgi:hypothetical protein